MADAPQVSVVVLTYHSAATVRATLDSIAAQTLGDLELIVTDDGSTDDTPAICDAWIREHRDRVPRARLLTSASNTGTAANFNRGCRAARGEWVKPLAGDDLLLPACLERNLDFARRHPEAGCIFSRVQPFRETGSGLEVLPFPDEDRPRTYAAMTAPEQHRSLLRSGSGLAAPTLFIRADLLRSVGGADERYRYLEDFPLYLALTRRGHRLWFLDEVTVRYRKGESLTGSGERLFVERYVACKEQVLRELVLPELTAGDAPWILQRWIDILVPRVAMRLFGNRRHWVSLALVKAANLARVDWYRSRLRRLRGRRGRSAGSRQEDPR